jgi:acyl-CoA thioester hydrolase
MIPTVIIRCPLNIQFYDLDPMNVVWHGNYVRFFEVARSALLDVIEFNYLQMQESGFIWPIVDLQIKYVRSLFLNQKAYIEAELVEYENRIVIKYTIFDEQTGEVLTKAKSVQVAVRESTREMEFETPQVMVDRITKYLNAQKITIEDVA